MSKSLAIVGLSSGLFRLIDSGIEVTGKPTLQEWVDAVEVVKGMVRVSPLALAGLYAYGKSRVEWAEEFYQVTEGYDRRTLENWMSLARKVKPEILAKAPSIGHADAVRSLPLTQQKKMIKAATDEQLTVMELRQRVRNDRKVPHSSGHADADAEACQRLIRVLHRLIKEAAQIGLEAKHEAVIEVCREVQDGWVNNILRLDTAANAAIASVVKAPKKRRKR